MKESKYCFNCGVEIAKNADVCIKCGAKQPLGSLPKTPKSKLTAGLLGIFLGGFGAHKFYLGNTGLGFLYLIFCWTYIPSIVGFIEGIVYLCMSEEEFSNKYNGR